MTRKNVHSSVLDDNWLNIRYLVPVKGDPYKYIVVFSDYSTNVWWWSDTGKVTIGLRYLFPGRVKSKGLMKP
jgi:hypothetical protein